MLFWGIIISSSSSWYKKEIKAINKGLEYVLKDSEFKEIVIFIHDRWDPDAVGSALCMAYILEQFGIPSRIIYSRNSYDYENREMYGICELNTLMTRTARIIHEKNLAGLQDELRSIKYSIVLDTQNPTKQLSYFDLINPFVYIDHHPEKNGDYANDSAIIINKKVGATVSILLDYIMQRGWELGNPDLSTLRITSYRGLETDTINFHKKLMTPTDYKIREYLEQYLTKADRDKIERIKKPDIPEDAQKEYFGTKYQPDLRGDLFIYHLPKVIKNDPGRISWLARKLFEEGVAPAVVVYGLADTTEDEIRTIELIASGRSNKSTIDLSSSFPEIFFKFAYDGSRIEYAGGRKLDDLSMAAAIMPFPQYIEKSGIRLQKSWESDLLDYKYRILNKFNIPLNDNEQIELRT